MTKSSVNYLAFLNNFSTNYYNCLWAFNHNPQMEVRITRQKNDAIIGYGFQLNSII